ncbi:tautomerase family protein [Nitrosophilus alvini]|uniref:tautomerase family protein n=1 Tax=Nitrosophilus alvini TaxID=2714855 RepID=UPI00190D8C55|nr:4-oxalocrotonate tautomerase family protein [Nitrosophilus alvini]
MPYINIKVAGKISVEQKKEIAKDISDSIQRVLGKSKKSCYIVFDEVERENWAVGDMLLSEKKKDG